MASTVAGILLTGIHASRPAANAAGLPFGSIYACSTHGLIYQTDGSSWTTWATMGGTYTDPLTTRGDLVTRGASATGRLAVGAANRLLRSDGTDPSWGQVVEADLNLTDLTIADASTTKHGFAPKYPNDATKYLDGTGAYSVPAGGGGAATFHGCHAYNSINVNLPNNVETRIPFDSERFDTDGFHDTSTNNSRFTVPTGMGGRYRFTCSLHWSTTLPGGPPYVAFVKNNGTFIGIQTAASLIYSLISSPVVALVATDYVELGVYHNNGGTPNLVAGAEYGIEMSMEFLG